MLSLITNPRLDFRYSKWRIQDGGRFFKNLLILPETCHLGVFVIADYVFCVSFKKSKNLRIQNGGNFFFFNFVNISMGPISKVNMVIK